MLGSIGRQLDHSAYVDAERIRARFSCGRKPDFRYALHLPFRGRKGKPKKVAAILKNPSAANECRADTTIRRVEEYVYLHFSDASELVILNLFAYRATYAKDVKCRMAQGEDVIGPCNDYYIRRYCARATDIIQAWGGNGPIPEGEYSARINALCRMLCAYRNKLWRVPKKNGSIPAYPLHGLRWSYRSCPKPISKLF